MGNKGSFKKGNKPKKVFTHLRKQNLNQDKELEKNLTLGKVVFKNLNPIALIFMLDQTKEFVDQNMFTNLTKGKYLMVGALSI